MSDKLPPAVVVGLEANGLGVARALARQRIPCIALASPYWNPCFQTKACRVVRSADWCAESVVEGLKSIGRGLNRKAPLLLTKDQAVLWVSDAREDLSEFFEIALPDKHTVDLLMNKVKFIEWAAREGWPVPLTWMIQSEDEMMMRLPEIIYPCILKPQLKNDTFRMHSPQKAFRASSAQELVQCYRKVAAWEKEVVIQEWIDGADDRIGFCLGYCSREAEPIALFAGRKLIQWPVGWGNTAISGPAPQEWSSAMTNLTAAIWKAAGYRGLGSVEYKFRRDTNAPVIMEPTVGRSDFQSEVAVLNGVNLPAIAYHDLARLPQPMVSSPSQHAMKLLDGPSHLQAARVFISSPGLGFLPWIRARHGRKRYMIFRHGDYGPFLASMWFHLRSGLGTLVTVIAGPSFKHKLRAKLAK